MVKAPVFIPSHHLGSEMKGIKFEGVSKNHLDREAEWSVAWHCTMCQRRGVVRFWRSESTDKVKIYERITAQHIKDNGCRNDRRRVEPPKETGRWRDQHGNVHTR